MVAKTKPKTSRAKTNKKPKKRICEKCINDCKQPADVTVIACKKYKFIP